MNSFALDFGVASAGFCRLASAAHSWAVLPSYFWLSNALGYPSGAGSNLAVRRKDFLAVGGFDSRMFTGEDIDLEKRLKGRTVFASKAWVVVSRRRLDAWGYWKLFSFHVVNWLRINLLGRASMDYEDVR